MKGIIFLEFLELVEDKFGLDLADDIIEQCELPSGAAYTAVGTYAFDEMVQLVSALSDRVGVSVPDLLQVYGEHLLGRFASQYPTHFEGISTTFELLARLDDTIHVEVKKLYPEAELPRFEANMISDQQMDLRYLSDKPLSTLAYGLILGSATHFNERIQIDMDDRSTPAQTDVLFRLEQVA